MPAVRVLFRPLTLLAALACSVLLPMHAQGPPPLAPAPNAPIPAPVSLYGQVAPGALGNKESDRPRLYPFIPATRSSRAAVLILPGGGYQQIALGHEGFQYAEWLNVQGIAAFVLDYRVAPYKYPVPIEDGVQAMRMIRAHATEYGIDPDRIGVWGSSAGGHLAAVLATECRVSDAPGSGLSGVDCMPNFAILAYPVISMELAGTPKPHPGSVTNLLGINPDSAIAHRLSPQYAVTPATPPTFIFATSGDPVVPVGNSVAMYSALQAGGVPVEMHLFDFSNHGCGLCGDIRDLAGWPLLLRAWMIHRNLMPPTAPPAPPPAANMPDWPSGIDGPGHTN